MYGLYGVYTYHIIIQNFRKNTVGHTRKRARKSKNLPYKPYKPYKTCLKPL